MKNLYIAVAVVATVLSTNPANVYARSQAAFLGSARFGSEQKCFLEHSGGPVQKNCTRVAWVVPILYHSAGWKELTVKAKGVNDTTRSISCRPYTASPSGAVLSRNPASTVRHDGKVEVLKLWINTLSWGGAWLTCYMDKGTHMYHVNYSY